MNKPIPKYLLIFFLLFVSFALKAQLYDIKFKTNLTIPSDSITRLKTPDERIQYCFQAHKTKSLDFISKYFISPWGNGIYSLPALGCIYTYGWANDDTQSKDAAIHGFESILLTTLTTSIFKLSFHRHRPNENDPPDSQLWDGPSFSRKYVSFPSGHTSSIFSIASLLSSEYKGKPSVAIIAYSIAGLTALSRIYDNKHWLTDVLAGAVLGFACGKLVYQWNNKAQ